jgi:hypothetical protein
MYNTVFPHCSIAVLEYVEFCVLVLNCAALCECWKPIDCEDAWKGKGMVWRVGSRRGNGSYIPMFRIASKILLGKIACLSLS